MAIDWSGYQIPAYLAAKEYRDTASNVGVGVPALAALGLSRNDVETGNLSEAIMGAGRSYYKDNVDKNIHKTYDDFLKSNDAGRYLKAAEGGAQFQNVGGDYQMKTPDGKWESIGQEAEDGVFDPYAGAKDLNQFEHGMREKMMGDWSGGTYDYRQAKSPLAALFSRERARPTSNIYQDSAKDALKDRFTQQGGQGIDWSTLSTPKGNLGWFPGSVMSRLIGKDKTKKGSNQTNTQVKGKKVSNNNNPGNNNQGVSINVQGADPYYFYSPKNSDPMKVDPELTFLMKDAGIDPAQFKKEYTNYLKSPTGFLDYEDYVYQKYKIAKPGYSPSGMGQKTNPNWTKPYNEQGT